MKILITGGSGFIGKNLIEGFSSKYEILAPTHDQLELTDEQAVEKYFKLNPVDIIIHGAVRPGHRNAKNPTALLDANLRMFFNLARNSDRYKKLILLSSGLVYDQRHYQPKMKEDYFGRHVPADESGFSKYISAKYVEKTENMVELRVFGIYGKYEDYAIRFISNMLCKAIFDLPLTIKQNRKFDYIFIEDLFPIIEYFMLNQGKYKAYNIAPDLSIELYALAEKVLKITGKKLPIVVGESKMGDEYSGDNSRLKEQIKDLRFTPFDAGIRKLYEWYRESKSVIKKECLIVDK